MKNILKSINVIELLLFSYKFKAYFKILISLISHNNLDLSCFFKNIVKLFYMYFIIYDINNIIQKFDIAIAEK